MEGYWITHCEIGTIQSDGIAITHAGELFGGDPEHIWSGSLEEEGAKLYARIRIVPVVSSQEVAVMARERRMILLLSGYCTDDFARLEGNVEGRQDLRFRITMRKCKAPKFEPTQPEMKAACTAGCCSSRVWKWEGEPPHSQLASLGDRIPEPWSNRYLRGKTSPHPCMALQTRTQRPD